MKKISTILPKDPNDLGKVIAGEIKVSIDHFKLKIDGTSCMVLDGKPYSRLDVKMFKRKKGKIITFTEEEILKKIPEGAIACQEPDEKSGHWPHWIPVIMDDPSQKYIAEGFNNLNEIIDGTYECIGPKIQDNPHGVENHLWIPHFHEKLIFELDNEWKESPFEFFKDFFKDFQWEGLVAYNSNGEPIGKIRRSDFGYPKITYGKPLV